MLLTIRNLQTHFFTRDGIARAVDGVSLEVPRRQTIALVGESGCGKSLTALSILRLVPPPGRVIAGEILLEGRNLLSLDERAMRAIRGDRVAMVFQEPMTSLNPVLSVGAQIAEALRLHRNLRGRAARDRGIALLRHVGIPAPERRVRAFPHQMSGGMRQRVMIAMALACEPDLLIADEPTTALDVTIQAQIMALLRQLQQQSGMSVLLITHDLGIVAGAADAVCVMYAGRIVERGPTRDLLAEPRHPYTQALLRSVPRLDANPSGKRARLAVIPGEVPRPLHRPSGCAFHPRCAAARGNPRCRTETPELVAISPTRACACHHVRAAS